MVKPIKLLKASFGNVGVQTYSTVAGIDNVPTQWYATLNVVSQPHSDPSTTPVANFYDGRNVSVGDYIVSSSEGKVLMISEITSQTEGQVVCLLDDVNNYNARNDDTGNLDGMIPNGAGIVVYIFEVVDNIPLISSLPSALPGNLSATFAQNVIARFQAQYPFVVVFPEDPPDEPPPPPPVLEVVDGGTF
jgi:hypothetical protein